MRVGSKRFAPHAAHILWHRVAVAPAQALPKELLLLLLLHQHLLHHDLRQGGLLKWLLLRQQQGLVIHCTAVGQLQLRERVREMLDRRRRDPATVLLLSGRSRGKALQRCRLLQLQLSLDGRQPQLLQVHLPGQVDRVPAGLPEQRGRPLLLPQGGRGGAGLEVVQRQASGCRPDAVVRVPLQACATRRIAGGGR